MTERQIAAWAASRSSSNTQPDISATGNRAVLDRAVRGGCWLRSDSVILDEPEADRGARPPSAWLAVVMEDGYHRHYRTDSPRYRVDAAGVDVIEHTMLHALDVGANYWSLWTEAENVARYRERRPTAFERSSGASATACARRGSGSGSARGPTSCRGLRQRRRLVRSRRPARLRRNPGRQASRGGGLDAGHPSRPAAARSFLLPQGMAGNEVRLRAELEVKGRRRPCAGPARSPSRRRRSRGAPEEARRQGLAEGNLR